MKKLYIWPQFSECSHDICIAYAESEEEAWKVLENEDNTMYNILRGSSIFNIKKIDPYVEEESVAFVSWRE